MAAPAPLPAARRTLQAVSDNQTQRLSAVVTGIVLTAVFNAADRELLVPRLKADVVGSPTLLFEDPQSDVDPEVKAAAQKIASVPLSQLSSIDDITAWSRAQLYLADFERAAAGYLLATRLVPNNATYHQRYALALFNRKAPITDVVAQLSIAYALVTDAAGKILPTADQRTVAAILENLTLSYLYVAPPDGFEIAIDYGRLAVAHPLVNKSRIWYYLASAYGQRYSWINDLRDVYADTPALQALLK